MWGLGVVLYFLISGFLPFEEEIRAELYAKIKASQYEIPKYISRDALKSIQKLLTKDTIKRLTMKDA